MEIAVIGLILCLGLMLLSILVFLGKLIYEVSRIAEHMQSMNHNIWEILQWVAKVKEGE